MKPGDYVVMIKKENGSYAEEYCKSNGLHIGGIYKYDRVHNNFTAVLITNITEVEVGIGFLEEHFSKSNRIENLDKLIKDEE